MYGIQGIPVLFFFCWNNCEDCKKAYTTLQLVALIDGPLIDVREIKFFFSIGSETKNDWI